MFVGLSIIGTESSRGLVKMAPERKTITDQPEAGTVSSRITPDYLRKLADEKEAMAAKNRAKKIPGYGYQKSRYAYELGLASGLRYAANLLASEERAA